ncbi:MAG: flavodoxin family protein [Syntrophobacterales bacterium]|nr:flavodoxin family protein [Syntrophobacterales bacterium]
MKPYIVAIYGSPRKEGNTARLLKEAVRGMREVGGVVTEFFLRDMKISPCMEIYGCKRDGRCVIEDDFQLISKALEKSDGIALASPVFFYTVSAHTKAFMDRCQSFWVRKYWIEKVPFGTRNDRRAGLFISVGATRGKKLFDGVLLTVRYFLDALDATLWNSLLYRGLDGPEDILKNPSYLEEAYEAGRAFVDFIRTVKKVDGNP